MRKRQPDGEGVVGLKQETMRLSELKPHPHNVRAHSRDNILAISRSLTMYGQQKPLVIDKDNQVLCGNGTLMAMRELGWGSCAVVRSGLTGKKAEAFAIADNKTTDLSHFDYEKLKEVMAELKEGGISVEDTGFSHSELEPLLPPTDEQYPSKQERTVTPPPKNSLVFTDEDWKLMERLQYELQTTTKEEAVITSVRRYLDDKH